MTYLRVLHVNGSAKTEYKSVRFYSFPAAIHISIETFVSMTVYLKHSVQCTCLTCNIRYGEGLTLRT